MSAVATETRTIPTGTWTVDASHSTIEFQVRDFMPGTIRGRFTDFEGTLEGGETASAHGVIRAASLTTHVEKRDAHLRSPDFLDTDRFPEIRFETSRVEHVDGDRFRFAGILTIQENPLEVELDATVVGPALDPYGNDRVHIEATGEITWGPSTVNLVVDLSTVRNG